MYALSNSESNLGRGDVALERGGGGERKPVAFAIANLEQLTGNYLALAIMQCLNNRDLDRLFLSEHVWA